MRRINGVFAHPEALIESTLIGSGTRIWAFAHVMKGARIGRDCNICDGVFVEGRAVLGNRVTVKNGVSIWNGVVIEDDAFIGPNAVFTNDRWPRSRGHRWATLQTTVRRHATIGANATLLCGLLVGEYAIVGAGAVVTRNVGPHAIVVGNPARAVGLACVCGIPLPRKRKVDYRCIECGVLLKIRSGSIVLESSEGR